jgi:N-acyl homoserine lactone hydrolase
MGAGTTVSILPCGAMTADLTWLLLAPGRAIRNRQNKQLRVAPTGSYR